MLSTTPGGPGHAGYSHSMSGCAGESGEFGEKIMRSNAFEQVQQNPTFAEPRTGPDFDTNTLVRLLACTETT